MKCMTVPDNKLENKVVVLFWRLLACLVAMGVIS